MSKSKLLLISFYYPPYPRVGGRRWAKHLKYLNREGTDFRVLAGGFSDMKSSWDKDVEEFSEKVDKIEISFKRPFFKEVLPVNFKQKIKWKLSYYSYTLKNFLTKKDLNDVSIPFTNSFITRSIELIEKYNIDVVVLSVGPFDYSRSLVEIKKKYPKVKVCVDFRDPWVDSYVGLKKRKKREQIAKEKELLAQVDCIITVNDELVKYYRQMCPKTSVCLVSHAFDPEDIILPSVVSGKDKAQLKMVYGGSLYHNTEPYLLLLNKLTESVNKYVNFRVDVYVSLPGYENELKNNNIKVYRNYIDRDQLFSEILSADYSMLLLPDNRRNAMSSKFYELLALRKPILYFGLEGAVSQFLTEKKLGFHITDSNLKYIVENLVNGTLQFNNSYDLDKHTFEEVNNVILEKVMS